MRITDRLHWEYEWNDQGTRRVRANMMLDDEVICHGEWVNQKAALELDEDDYHAGQRRAIAGLVHALGRKVAALLEQLGRIDGIPLQGMNVVLLAPGPEGGSPEETGTRLIFDWQRSTVQVSLFQDDSCVAVSPVQPLVPSPVSAGLEAVVDLLAAVFKKQNEELAALATKALDDARRIDELEQANECLRHQVEDLTRQLAQKQKIETSTPMQNARACMDQATALALDRGYSNPPHFEARVKALLDTADLWLQYER